ncbi:MAG TPA: hypothetical protein VG650_18655 [Mycobacteriales bacterium]|nr:hypothetical protein [Mycobacteriales bacterium]
MSSAAGSYTARDVLPASHARTRATTRAVRINAAVWLLRLPLAVPFILMTPEIAAALRGRPHAIEHLQSSSADVLGNAGLAIFVLMLAVTPIWTMTGWRWHVVLRRDYGVAMFLVALLDLVLAALVTSNRFPGGFMTRVTGHSFLAVGTLATLMCVPLAVTANKRAQRALGRYWKPLHRMTYVVWVAILLHLLLLFGFHDVAIHALEVSTPLLLLRMPRIRQWCVATRKARTHRVRRAAVGVVSIAVFSVGFVPIVHDLAVSGSQAFIQQPAD